MFDFIRKRLNSKKPTESVKKPSRIEILKSTISKPKQPRNQPKLWIYSKEGEEIILKE